MKHRFLLLALLTTLPVALAAQTPAPQTPPAAPAAPAALPAPPDVAAPPADAQRTPSGLVTKVLTPGSGTRHPKEGSTVKVNYTGWTTDGKMFDSSLSRGVPASFNLQKVIPGWTEGLQLMTE